MVVALARRLGLGIQWIGYMQQEKGEVGFKKWPDIRRQRIYGFVNYDFLSVRAPGCGLLRTERQGAGGAEQSDYASRYNLKALALITDSSTRDSRRAECCASGHKNSRALAQ